MSPYRTPARRPREPQAEPIDPWFSYCMARADACSWHPGLSRWWYRQALPILPLWRRVLGLR